MIIKKHILLLTGLFIALVLNFFIKAIISDYYFAGANHLLSNNYTAAAADSVLMLLLCFALIRINYSFIAPLIILAYWLTDNTYFEYFAADETGAMSLMLLIMSFGIIANKKMSESIRKKSTQETIKSIGLFILMTGALLLEAYNLIFASAIFIASFLDSRAGKVRFIASFKLSNAAMPAAIISWLIVSSVTGSNNFRAVDSAGLSLQSAIEVFEQNIVLIIVFLTVASTVLVLKHRIIRDNFYKSLRDNPVLLIGLIFNAAALFIAEQNGAEYLKVSFTLFLLIQLSVAVDAFNRQFSFKSSKHIKANAVILFLMLLLSIIKRGNL